MYYLFYKVRREDICIIKTLLETYENMMLVSTIDEAESKIQITIAPDFLDDCKTVIEDLRKEFLMIPISDPPDVSQGNY